MKEHGLTISEALHETFSELSASGVPSARDEAEFILMHVLGCKRSELFLNARRPLTGEEEKLLRGVVERRVKREPSQYIFGEAEFRGRPFKVTRDVLIPRPETELIISEALKEAPSFGASRLTMVDLCTGSGCIGISAAMELEGSQVFATDISERALAVASGNAERLGVGERVRFAAGDLFSPLPEELKGRVHMVLSNPPYINDNDIPGLEPEVRDFEPMLALAGGPGGLDIIRRILSEASLFLVPGGLLLMEIGYEQKEPVSAEARRAGWERIEIINDYAGIGRILKARSKGS